MKKHLYQAPVAEIILTDAADILTTSGVSEEVIELPKVEF